ncbi:MAG: hypothetical protein HYV29_06615 [Ignavibacteriales bacterium]|nr:hypothetical protein [Ignavibacteriales bacterium]
MKKLCLFLMIISFQPLFSQLRSFGFYFEVENSVNLLNLVSVETLPCMGYGIRTVQLWNHDTLVIDIRGFRRPEPCYPDMDVAKERIALVGIRTKNFAVKFRWKKEEDLWKVTVHGGWFTVTPVRTAFTSYLK